jgi:hypothetical protein
MFQRSSAPARAVIRNTHLRGALVELEYFSLLGKSVYIPREVNKNMNKEVKGRKVREYESTRLSHHASLQVYSEILYTVSVLTLLTLLALLTRLALSPYQPWNYITPSSP